MSEEDVIAALAAYEALRERLADEVTRSVQCLTAEQEQYVRDKLNSEMRYWA